MLHTGFRDDGAWIYQARSHGSPPSSPLKMLGLEPLASACHGVQAGFGLGESRKISHICKRVVLAGGCLKPAALLLV